MGYAFQADSRRHFVAPVFQSVVALRIELSAARLSAEHGQPALDDRMWIVVSNDIPRFNVINLARTGRSM